MVTLLYAGPAMFGITYDMINCPSYVTSYEDSSLDGEPTNKLLHYTFLFNTFMMMQLFNSFNCRKLGVKDYNIFSRIYNNLLFLIIVAGEFVVQFFIVYLGGIVGEIFGTTPLTFTMAMVSIAFGAGSLLVAVILKATPEEWCEKLKF